VVLHVEPPEEPYDIARADADLTHLRNAGVLDRLAALTVGRIDGFDERDRRLLDHCVLDAVAGFDYPVLAGVECSHAAPMLALPVGVRATVSGAELIIDEAAVGP
jgi:muramoyltetrapeptide carboxypeptidase